MRQVLALMDLLLDLVVRWVHGVHVGVLGKRSDVAGPNDPRWFCLSSGNITHVRICEAVKGITVACFGSIEPSLFDGEPKTSMIEPNKGTNARQIQAAGVKGRLGGQSCQGQAAAEAPTG